MKTTGCTKNRQKNATGTACGSINPILDRFWVSWEVPKSTKNEAQHALQKQMKKTCKEKRPKDEKGASGGGVRRNARGGGEDPRRGIRTDQGQNPGKSFGQEMRAGQELEELERASSTPCPQQSWGGGSLRAFRRLHLDDWRITGLEDWKGWKD